jgi:succinyl-diaminopimelate desuccinylase
VRALDLTADGPALTAALIDVPSVSGDEETLADLIAAALRDLGHLEVARDGDAVLARTALGRDKRVLLAGHLDTVPIADNVPSTVDGDRLYGCGASDMKSGDAVMLRLAATLRDPAYDLTWIFYDNEEVESSRSGLGRVARNLRHWLYADLAIMMEPTSGQVEAGCQGTLRATVSTRGRRAHSARSWLGDNAIHGAGAVLRRLSAYEPRSVDIDGCGYREGLNAVGISGGVAGNVVPDECSIEVNFRFAPDRTVDDAAGHLREVLSGYDVVVTDSAPGALPGLQEPAAAAFVEAVGLTPVAKYGWTDVSRFAAFGIPAVNYGPGDPNQAHTREEHVRIGDIVRCERVLSYYLS